MTTFKDREIPHKNLHFWFLLTKWKMWCPWSSLEMRHGLTSANISKTILACVAWGTPVKRPESQETTSSNRRHVVIRSLRIPNVVLCFKWSKTCTEGTATPTKAPAQPFPFQESRSCPWRLFFCHHFHLLSNWLSHKANFWFFPQLTLSFSKWQVHPYKTLGSFLTLSYLPGQNLALPQK